MSWKINYSASSKKDLKAIFDYISCEFLSPKHAAEQVERIMKAGRSLADMPMRHQVYEEEPWKSRQVRSVPVDHYIIFYLPKEENETVHILRIIYGGRNLQHQKPETKERL